MKKHKIKSIINSIYLKKKYEFKKFIVNFFGNTQALLR